MISFHSKAEREKMHIEAMQERMVSMSKKLSKRKKQIELLEAKRIADSASELESSDSESDESDSDLFNPDRVFNNRPAAAQQQDPSAQGNSSLRLD